ncbi:hypothetical protein NM688_g7395 [Phlebia brevispora]|uniref:Uncharacterized protein n=1 Tax=Phlebia brevispora TaxID=194682 RepID=A0ACC1S5K3_9APHY|nr:hypothetical protein NM688_g7395 [Phlebia brevispora]
MTVQGIPIGYTAIMLAVLASMGGFIFGYDTGQISDILLMDDFLERFAQCKDHTDVTTCKFSIVREGLIVALLSIGTLIGALGGSWIADFLGRRYAMTSECCMFMIGVIIQITSTKTWAQFAVGRLISGFGIGALSAAVPMYQAETAPPPIRGTLTATYQLFITLGILVSSNFERLLWYLAYEGLEEKDAETRRGACETLAGWMLKVKNDGKVQVPAEVLELARRDFVAERISDEQTLDTIRAYFKAEPSYVADPHTAVGLAAARIVAASNPPSTVQVVLSTAHPAKFSEAVTRALQGEPNFNFERDVLPPEFKGLLEKERRVIDVPAPDVELIVTARYGQQSNSIACSSVLRLRALSALTHTRIRTALECGIREHADARNSLSLILCLEMELTSACWFRPSATGPTVYLLLAIDTEDSAFSCHTTPPINSTPVCQYLPIVASEFMVAMVNIVSTSSGTVIDIAVLVLARVKDVWESFIASHGSSSLFNLASLLAMAMPTLSTYPLAQKTQSSSSSSRVAPRFSHFSVPNFRVPTLHGVAGNTGERLQYGVERTWDEDDQVIDGNHTETACRVSLAAAGLELHATKHTDGDIQKVIGCVDDVQEVHREAMV